MRPRPWGWRAEGMPNELRLFDGRGRQRASVWSNPDNVTWHTYDEYGTGGENSVIWVPGRLDDAKDQVIASIVRQGWAPGGWTVES